MSIKDILRNNIGSSPLPEQLKVLLASCYLRKNIKTNWEGITSQPDFQEKYLRLIKGMDAQSVSTVDRILAMLEAILACNSKFFSLCTPVEKRKLRELKENFFGEILKLSDDKFAYKNYLLPINHFEASVFYYKHGINEVETIARTHGKTIMDVGGYIGDSALIFQELGADKIYTFEALPDNFELLKRTLALNNVKNVVAENVALGAEKGECSLYVAGNCTGSVNRGIVYQGKIDVPVITLDDYVEEHKIENIGLIKVDIEGAEPDFLVGAKKTICEQRPILLISIYHNPHDFFELKPLIESWNLGYRFKIHKPTIYNVIDETLLIAEIV